MQSCQKFVQNYRVAMRPICYNVVGEEGESVWDQDAIKGFKL